MTEKTDSRELLIATAARLFEHGVAAAGLLQIAEAAGVSKGLLQHYFRHKGQLVAVVAERAVQAGRCAGNDSAWPRLWMALRTASGNDDGLAAVLDTLRRTEVHPTRIVALERELFEAHRRREDLFAGEAAA
jgi:AcrR family transcriptional regulator